MEVKRQLAVLDRYLADNQNIYGEEYMLADMTIWPWYGSLSLRNLYDAAVFLDLRSYKHLTRWSNEITEQKAVKRGRVVNNLL